jgi:hypothetical protein
MPGVGGPAGRTPSSARTTIGRACSIGASSLGCSAHALGLTADELQAGYLWMYREFYSFRNIWRRMPESRRQRAPYLLFNFGYRKFGWTTALVAKLGLLTWVGRLARRLAYNVE